MANTPVQGYSIVRSSGIALPDHMNEYSDKLVAFGAPTHEELVRQGQGWSVMNVLAIAALVVRPTTVAAVEIWNGHQTRSLVIDRLFGFNLVSTAVNSAAGLWATVTRPKAAPSAGANVVPWGQTGKAYNGPVVVGLGTTIADVPSNGNAWFPYGPQYSAPNAAAPGGSWEAAINGRIIVPPQASLGIHVVGSIVGDTYQCGAAWFERLLTLM
jgi:hypothetical protein